MLQKPFRRVRPCKNISENLQHNIAKNTSFKTQEAITKLELTVLPHPSYSPGLARSDFHFFGTLINAIRGQRFGRDEVIEEVIKWLRVKNSNSYRNG
jgi:histone-lysine N-methyltransferase SETMAR